MTPDPTADLWSFFDRIYCITLKERPDRRAQVEEQFVRVGLAGRVAYWVVERHPTDCEQGIYESHMACMRQALADGARRILIFEDDVMFERFSPERFRAALAFLERHPDWQIFFLGCMVKRSRTTETPAVRQVACRCLSHAYALHRPCAEQLVQNPWRGAPFDAILSRLSYGVYACYPFFAFQSDSASDNRRHQRLETFRRWCGGLRRIQKFNEWYHCHRAALVILHLVGLGVLLWMVLGCGLK
jgi:GR25 family glycosyltransferase involved in LPS biosynthesis